MNAKTFRENYEIDRTKNGLRVIEKVKLPKRRKVTIWTTASGKVYNPQSIYYFFDMDGLNKQVRTNIGLSLNEEKGHLDSLGYRVVGVLRLRDTELEALDDGSSITARSSRMQRRKLQK